MSRLETLSNAEIQKLYIKDKAGDNVWEKRSHKVHLDNLRKLQEQARGTHGRKKS